MRPRAFYVAAGLILLPPSCFGIVSPLSHTCGATRTAVPRRHRTTKHRLEFETRGERDSTTRQSLGLAAGGGSPLETNSDPAASAVDTGTSSPLLRAKEVLVEPAFRNMLLPLMATAGAMLGPNLDNYHSAFGVLAYKDPIEIYVGGYLLVTTDWWVPPLFAVAGAGIGGLYILLDVALETPQAKREPVWRDVFLSISLFSFQYYLSGLLTAEECPYWVFVMLLTIIAERTFNVFDATRVGLLVSLATAVLGPLIEVFLVNATDLYGYIGADFFGVDSWIPVVYFCGGPAVGSLARALYAKLLATSNRESLG